MVNKKDNSLISIARKLESKVLESKEGFVDKLISESLIDSQLAYYDTDDLLAINLDEILDPNKKKSDIELKMILAAKDLSNELNVTETVYTPIVIMLLISLVHGRTNETRALFSVLMSAAAHIMTLQSGAEKLGALGGRPEHVRKGEALDMARKRWEQIPYASVNHVATYVKSKLESKYTDAPKLPSIKAWLKKADLNPRKKQE